MTPSGPREIDRPIHHAASPADVGLCHSCLRSAVKIKLKNGTALCADCLEAGKQ